MQHKVHPSPHWQSKKKYHLEVSLIIYIKKHFLSVQWKSSSKVSKLHQCQYQVSIGSDKKGEKKLILHKNYFSFIFRTKIKVTFVDRFDPLSISFVTPPSQKKEKEKIIIQAKSCWIRRLQAISRRIWIEWPEESS